MAKKNGTRNLGLAGIEAPKEECTDVHCPFHGELSVRGRTFEGEVVSIKPARTVVVSWGRRFFVPKYERFEKRKSKVNAHLPPCMHLKVSDKVMIGECRPISKTKKFVVISASSNDTDVNDSKEIKAKSGELQ